MTHRKTALLIVDVINSFFDPAQQHFFAAARDVLEPIRRLREAAALGSSPVVHAAQQHRPGFDDAFWRRFPRQHLSGAPDAQFYGGYGPAGANETVVYKRRYSAFFATDLALFLQEQDVGRVVIAGVKTNVCVRATAQDAFAYGFDVVVAREATSSNRPHLAAASLEDIDRYLGCVVELHEAVAMLSGSRPDAR